MRFIRYTAIAYWVALAMWGHFGPPNNAPVKRLLSNLGTYVNSHPGDAKGYYTLGRIHYLAFALNVATLDYWDGDFIQPVAGLLPGRAATTGRQRRELTENER